LHSFFGGLQFLFRRRWSGQPSASTWPTAPTAGPGIQDALRQRIEPVHDGSATHGECRGIQGSQSAARRARCHWRQPRGERLQSQVHCLRTIGWRGCGIHPRCRALQSLPQQLGKQMVIAIPAPLVVQRDDEQVGALEVGQGPVLTGTCCSPASPCTTASHRGPHMRSRMAVRSKKVWTLSDCCPRTSSTR
jgi:hypothetical protein